MQHTIEMLWVFFWCMMSRMNHRLTVSTFLLIVFYELFHISGIALFLKDSSLLD
jgi:hypothetical protein